MALRCRDYRAVCAGAPPTAEPSRSRATLAARGVGVSDAAINFCVIRFVPGIEKRWNRFALIVITLGVLMHSGNVEFLYFGQW